MKYGFSREWVIITTLSHYVNKDCLIISFKIGILELKTLQEQFFYRSFATFQFQPYLDKVNISKYLYAFSKLRMSSHRLEVESGRWVRPNRTPLDERKCFFCNVLEDEYHFVLECSVYLELRKKYISKYFWKRPNMFKFIDLINSSSTSCIRKLCTIIFQAFKLRPGLLYSTRN